MHMFDIFKMNNIFCNDCLKVYVHDNCSINLLLLFIQKVILYLK